ncbi:MAG: DUF424 family protein [Ignisphaera sp.]
MSLYFMKIHSVGGKKIVAVCDEEILGMVFREGDVVLDISPRFYGGKKADLEEVMNEIMDADIVVLSGKRIVEELDRRGAVIKDHALRVGDQLHIQIVREVLEI